MKSKNGKRFGGYTSISWKSLNRYIPDEKAFLFSLDLRKCFKKQNNPQAIYDHYNYGPTFGAGHDLYIADQCKNSNGSYCNPSTYNEVKANELSGEKNFMVENYEVYSVIFV